jgi:demethylmenaquinone methyltransferase/2-methoxy-6-polyprenyl-1,4-benzoquinol methylase
MFERIAARYDLLNGLMTFGMDRGWRRRAVAEARLTPTGRALDVGTGTGALARDLAGAVSRGRVVGLDFAPAMLALAGARRAETSAALAFVQGDGLRLPFAGGSFDCVTSGFAVRNMADLRAAFAEQARVLRPGGRVVCLELTPARLPVFRRVFRGYFHYWVPLLGRVVAGDAAAYTYLPQSVDRFPDAEALVGLLEAVGLVRVRYSLLGLGTVALHVAEKP